jgi:hypothetical protein
MTCIKFQKTLGNVVSAISSQTIVNPDIIIPNGGNQFVVMRPEKLQRDEEVGGFCKGRLPLRDLGLGR